MQFGSEHCAQDVPETPQPISQEVHIFTSDGQY